MSPLALTWSLVLSLGVALPFASQDRIPTGKGPAKLIVGFRASGSTDVLARLLAYKLRHELNTGVIVEIAAAPAARLQRSTPSSLSPTG